MGPLVKIARTNMSQTKRIVKFIDECYDPRLRRYLLQNSPDSVYKSICNVFYNVAHNPKKPFTSKFHPYFQNWNRHLYQSLPKIIFDNCMKFYSLEISRKWPEMKIIKFENPMTNLLRFLIFIKTKMDNAHDT